jgi:hypothetical protein
MEDLIKDEYRELTGEDFYCDDYMGCYTDEYVYWLEDKIDNLIKLNNIKNNSQILN